MYVLLAMFLTLPTSQEERSPLKPRAPSNTARTETTNVPMRRMGRKNRHLIKLKIISANQKWNEESASQTRFEEDNCVNVLLSMVVTLPTFQEERSPLKESACTNTALTGTQQKSKCVKWGGKQTFDQIENHQCKPKNGTRKKHPTDI